MRRVREDSIHDRHVGTCACAHTGERRKPTDVRIDRRTDTGAETEGGTTQGLHRRMDAQADRSRQRQTQTRQAISGTHAHTYAQVPTSCVTTRYHKSAWCGPLDRDCAPPVVNKRRGALGLSAWRVLKGRCCL